MLAGNTFIYCFGTFEFDPRTAELRKSGIRLKLQDQPRQVLLQLLERRGEVVSRDQLRSLLWSEDTFVDFETGLNTAVKRLRDTLGDSADSPTFIETIPRKGYRFIAPVEVISRNGRRSETAHPTPVRNLRSQRFLSWTIASTLTLVLGLPFAWHLFSLGKPHLTEKDTIIVADFANSTGDPVFDDTLKQGLRVQLEQSPFLNVLSERKVDEQLKLMMRPAGESLTPELARDLCQRSGSTVVVKGTISRLGTIYVLGLSAFNCRNGEELDNEQVEAPSREQVLKALGEAARNMRLKLGESLATVQKFNAPLEEATTPDLGALKAYSLGVSKLGRGDPSAAIPLFQKAIELDPAFAAAYLQLGSSYGVLGKWYIAREPHRKAYELRNRASERERFTIVALYHQVFSSDLQQTMENCELWEQSYPRDFLPHRILGWENGVLGNYERSAEEYAKARDLDPGQSIPYAALITDYTALNRIADAEAVYQDAKAHHVAAGLVDAQAYFLAFVQNNAQEMARVSVALSGEPGFEIWAFREETNTAAYFGHFRAARQLTARMKEIALQNKDSAVAADFLSDQAFREMLVGNDGEARKYAAEATKLGGEPPTALMLSSDPATASRMVDLLDSKSPRDGYMHKARLPLIRGFVELKRGNTARALELFAPSLPYESGYLDLYLPAYLRGEAYLVAHRGQEAATEFEKITGHRGIVLNKQQIGAVAHAGLARAYAMQGDKVKAKAAYRDFLTLWKDADADIPILKQAKDEYMKLQ